MGRRIAICHIRNVVKNYRWITILKIYCKTIWNLGTQPTGLSKGSLPQNRWILCGVLEGKSDGWWYVYTVWSHTETDGNGEPLYVCYVDFSTAVDLVNRHILFYKLIKQWWCGGVIGTLWLFCTKTYFRVKVDGRISLPIPNHIGVNQGENISGLLFRKYLTDLDEYLRKEVGDTIIAHLLWEDDLILVTDSIKELQKQLDGLFNFCSDNMMIVNETKTKVMVCGSARRDIVFKFNDRCCWPG